MSCIILIKTVKPFPFPRSHDNGSSFTTTFNINHHLPLVYTFVGLRHHHLLVLLPLATWAIKVYDIGKVNWQGLGGELGYLVPNTTSFARTTSINRRQLIKNLKQDRGWKSRLWKRRQYYCRRGSHLCKLQSKLIWDDRVVIVEACNFMR